jgi:hypothetical protein
MNDLQKTLYLMTSSSHLGDLQLKDFFKIVENIKGKKPDRFSFNGPEPKLHKHISLSENIFFESPFGTIKEKNKKQYSHSNFGGNVYLFELFERLRFPETMPMDSGLPAQKLASLIRSILRPDPFLFLVSPQLYLDRSTLELLGKALLAESQANKKTILIAGLPAVDWPLGQDVPFIHIERDQDKRPMVISIGNSFRPQLVSNNNYSQSMEENRMKEKNETNPGKKLVS